MKLIQHLRNVFPKHSWRYDHGERAWFGVNPSDVVTARVEADLASGSDDLVRPMLRVTRGQDLLHEISARAARIGMVKTPTLVGI